MHSFAVRQAESFLDELALLIDDDVIRAGFLRDRDLVGRKRHGPMTSPPLSLMIWVRSSPTPPAAAWMNATSPGLHRVENRLRSGWRSDLASSRRPLFDHRSYRGAAPAKRPGIAILSA